MARRRTDARLCAAAGHALPRYDIRPDWHATNVDRMRDVLRAKFIQHPHLVERLLETGDAVLVEDSPSDTFWGIGRSGRGKSMLGSLLMELRHTLSADSPASTMAGMGSD